MIKLNIAFHEGIERPADHDDDDEIVQATNLWFDAEIEPQDLLDAIEQGEQAVSDLLGCLYDEATRFYRIWDNYKPGEHWEDVTNQPEDFTPENALDYHEWHADVDWDNGRYYSLLGSGFNEPIASDELINYLTECAS